MNDLQADFEPLPPMFEDPKPRQKRNRRKARALQPEMEKPDEPKKPRGKPRRKGRRPNKAALEQEFAKVRNVSNAKQGPPFSLRQDHKLITALLQMDTARRNTIFMIVKALLK